MINEPRPSQEKPWTAGRPSADEEKTMGGPHFASRGMEQNHRASARRRSSGGTHVTFALLLSISCLLLAHGIFAMTPVILSTDVGNEIDDQWVVVYALTNSQVEVLGLISAHAPTLTPPAAHTTYRILVDVVENRLHMQSHPPLFEGASSPLEDRTTPRVNDGVNFIIQASQRFSRDNRLTLLTIGAVTDAASAIIIDPSIVDRIRIVDMGFEKWPEGRDEFNVANDVKAMQVLVDSGVPLVVGSGDVCRAHLALSLGQAKELVSTHGPVGRWLWEDFQAWYYRIVKPLRKDDFSRPWIIWDNVVMAYILGMTTQVEYPRPRLRDDMTFEPTRTDKKITWITSVDEKRLWADFIEKLDSYQRTHAVREGGGRVLPTWLSPP